MEKLKHYKYTVAAAVLILFALLLPGSTFSFMSKNLLDIDKLAHMALFFIFTLAFQLEYKAANRRAPQFFRSALLILAFSIGSEALQLTTSTRSFDPADMAADLIGASLAAIVAAVAHRVSANRRRKD